MKNLGIKAFVRRIWGRAPLPVEPETAMDMAALPLVEVPELVPRVPKLFSGGFVILSEEKIQGDIQRLIGWDLAAVMQGAS